VTVPWSCTAHGQRSDEPADAPEASPQIQKAADRYQQEIDRHLEMIKQTPDRVDGYLELSRLYRTTGRYDLALEPARKAAGIDPASGLALQAAGELHLLRGEYEQAEPLLSQARSRGDASLTAALSLGLLYLERGRKREAQAVFQELIRAYQQGRARRADEVMAVALAAKHLERFHDANDLLSEATRLNPSYKDAFVAWGRLFLEKYNRSEAVSIFEEALKIDPAYPPALAGLAEALAENRPAQAEAKCREALEINPNLMEARHLLVRLFLVDEAYDEAIEQIQKVLAVHPSSPATRALLAACYHAMGRQADYDAECRRVLEVNPGYGQLYAILADNLSRRYRFREAIEMGHKAIALDPELWSAYASLGINLSRVGEEAAGRRYLEQAFEHDAFNTWTYNTLNLFDAIEQYATLTSEHFILKLHREEDPVYGKLALELLEEAYRTISPRYGFTTNRPVLVEIFPKHDDFAVRISGLPGAGALLGVCFGEVIVADSPRARSGGTFNWGQALWHEFAHVVHLQLTRNRIPRWLAEGIAVYEARMARPEWNIDLETDFAAAVERKRLLKVSELNSGFTRPKSADQVVLSYYQASVVVEYIIERHGFDALRTMLRLYREDKGTGDVVAAALGESMDALDRAFLTYAEERTAATRRALRFTPSTEKELTEADLRAAADDHPESFYAHLFLGRLLAASGKADEAIEAFKKARDLIPSYVQGENPYRLLADLYRKRGDAAATVRELEALTAIDEDDLAACKELADLYITQQRYDEGIRALTRAVMINPFDAKVRNMRGSAFERQRRYDKAITEFQAALAVETTDRAMAHYNLARVYLAADRPAEAKQAALQALEIAPNYEAAQEILLKTVK
jgi:tetratricopeptide (TPR) repeat protein